VETRRADSGGGRGGEEIRTNAGINGRRKPVEIPRKPE